MLCKLEEVDVIRITVYCEIAHLNNEPFYLAGESKDQLRKLIERAAAIGYEPQIKEAFVLEFGTQSEPMIDVDAFKENLDDYTIIDVRNASELKESKLNGPEIS